MCEWFCARYSFKMIFATLEVCMAFELSTKSFRINVCVCRYIDDNYIHMLGNIGLRAYSSFLIGNTLVVHIMMWHSHDILYANSFGRYFLEIVISCIRCKIHKTIFDGILGSVSTKLSKCRAFESNEFSCRAFESNEFSLFAIQKFSEVASLFLFAMM